MPIFASVSMELAWYYRLEKNEPPPRMCNLPSSMTKKIFS
jgi:hypothetical protein